MSEPYTVAHYFDNHFAGPLSGRRTLTQRVNENTVRNLADKDYRWSYDEFPVNSVCGAICCQLVNQAYPLVQTISTTWPNDDGEPYIDMLLDGVAATIALICFG